MNQSNNREQQQINLIILTLARNTCQFMHVAHSPTTKLYSRDKEANYYRNLCAKSGSHFHSLLKSDLL